MACSVISYVSVHPAPTQVTLPVPGPPRDQPCLPGYGTHPVTQAPDRRVTGPVVNPASPNPAPTR